MCYAATKALCCFAQQNPEGASLFDVIVDAEDSVYNMIPGIQKQTRGPGLLRTRSLLRYYNLWREGCKRSGTHFAKERNEEMCVKKKE